ncbi:hypothetical protein OIO90_003207 [Microbotryomycetes sp. JL221]|nr:hypothetical protein OIO90_003207 [Microbotryomycetes sp. JL221]
MRTPAPQPTTSTQMQSQSARQADSGARAHDAACRTNPAFTSTVARLSHWDQAQTDAARNAFDAIQAVLAADDLLGGSDDLDDPLDKDWTDPLSVVIMHKRFLCRAMTALAVWQAGESTSAVRRGQPDLDREALNGLCIWATKQCKDAYFDILNLWPDQFKLFWKNVLKPELARDGPKSQLGWNESLLEDHKAPSLYAAAKTQFHVCKARLKEALVACLQGGVKIVSLSALKAPPPRFRHGAAHAEQRAFINVPMHDIDKFAKALLELGEKPPSKAQLIWLAVIGGKWYYEAAFWSFLQAELVESGESLKRSALIEKWEQYLECDREWFPPTGDVEPARDDVLQGYTPIVSRLVSHSRPNPIEYPLSQDVLDPGTWGTTTAHSTALRAGGHGASAANIDESDTDQDDEDEGIGLQDDDSEPGNNQEVDGQGRESPPDTEKHRRSNAGNQGAVHDESDDDAYALQGLGKRSREESDPPRRDYDSPGAAHLKTYKKGKMARANRQRDSNSTTPDVPRGRAIRAGTSRASRSS